MSVHKNRAFVSLLLNQVQSKYKMPDPIWQIKKLRLKEVKQLALVTKEQSQGQGWNPHVANSIPRVLSLLHHAAPCLVLVLEKDGPHPAEAALAPRF